MPKTLKYHFMLNDKHDMFVLMSNPGPVGHAGHVGLAMSWPTKGYSREKALNRADRYVGEQARREDEGQGVIIVYTHDGQYTAISNVAPKGCLQPAGNYHRSILRPDGTCPGCVDDEGRVRNAGT